MSRWPTVDPLRRARALAALRRSDTRRAAMGTPASRVERMFELISMASLLGAQLRPHEGANSDESFEDWRRIKTRLRAADARR